MVIKNDADESQYTEDAPAAVSNYERRSSDTSHLVEAV